MKRGTTKDERNVRKNFTAKLREVGKRLPFVRDLRALYRYMLDSDVAWIRKSVAVGALAYFIMPLDAIPDLAPVVGYLDDAGVVTAAVAYLSSEIEPYYQY